MALRNRLQFEQVGQSVSMSGYCYNRPSMEQSPRKGSWQIWVGMLVGVASLAAVFIFFAEPGEIIESLRHVNIGYLLLGAVGVVLFLAVRAVRWRFMLGNAVPYAPVLHIQRSC